MTTARQAKLPGLTQPVLFMFAAVVNAAFPVFALILTGWGCARLGIMGPTSTEGLNRFVVYLALPAQLFAAMAHAPLGELARPGFFFANALGMLVTASGYAWLSRKLPGDPVDRIINGMSATYSNAGFMGIPLCLMVFGKSGLSASILCTLFTVSALFAVTIMLIELRTLQGRHPGSAMVKVGAALLRNPILIAPLLGVAWSSTGWELPAAPERFVELIGSAATPCALIAIGLFLAQSAIQNSHSGCASSLVFMIVGLKLLVQPLVTAVLVLWVFDVPRLWAQVAILSAALPVGTGPYMLAQIYHRDAAVSARAILLSTIGSVATISLIIAWIGANP